MVNSSPQPLLEGDANVVKMLLVGVLGFLTYALSETNLPAGSSGVPPKSVEPRVRLTLEDGSVLKGTLANESVTISTSYGVLTVPLSEIRSIRFGMHLSESDAKEINAAYLGLGNGVFKVREHSGRILFQKGKRAVPTLLLAMKSSDREVSKSAGEIHAKILERDSSAENVQLKDRIETREMPIVGFIKLDVLKIRSKALGEIAVNIPDVASLLFTSMGDARLKLDAAKHGSALDQWCDTGITVERGVFLNVKASGQVDLYPVGIGQYVASPKGFNVTGKGGQFNAGALIGKVGDNGKAFLLGENFRAEVSEGGTLFVMITPSPWNNASVGVYDVEIAVTEK